MSLLDKIVITVMALILGVILGLSAQTVYESGKKTAIKEQQAKAVEARVAYYDLNHQTGEIEFKYVDINEVIQSVIQQFQQHMFKKSTAVYEGP